MTERSPAGADREAVCPFVAFDDDRDFRSTVPDHRHRCFAESPAASRALAHQAAYCLSSAFPGCPTFMDWARREAAPPVEQPNPTLRQVPTAPRQADRAGEQASRPVAPQSTPAPPQRQRRAEWTAPPPWAAQAGAAGAGASGRERPGRAAGAGAAEPNRPCPTPTAVRFPTSATRALALARGPAPRSAPWLARAPARQGRDRQGNRGSSRSSRRPTAIANRISRRRSRRPPRSSPDVRRDVPRWREPGISPPTQTCRTTPRASRRPGERPWGTRRPTAGGPGWRERAAILTGPPAAV